MAVDDRGKIDFAYTEGERVVLEIFDHLPWDRDSIEAHMMILTDKLKDYAMFIRSGQYRETFSDREYHPIVRIVFTQQWPEIIDRFLASMKDALKTDIEWLLWHPKKETN